MNFLKLAAPFYTADFAFGLTAKKVSTVGLPGEAPKEQRLVPGVGLEPT